MTRRPAADRNPPADAYRRNKAVGENHARKQAPRLRFRRAHGVPRPSWRPARCPAQAQDKKPNILVIWGDDIGIHNISAYNHGIMGYQTPNIDRIAKEGALFTDSYGQQSCTAGRASFILGQHPFRTGLLTIGMPGSPQGIPTGVPTIADLLKEQGYATGQFGKNHLGDRDEHLPTMHGFDEFFGNLYHLNAEEEPETYYYPKDPAFRKKFGPRGVLHTWCRRQGRAENRRHRPADAERMPTIDEEILCAADATSSTSRPRTRSRSSSGSTPRACTSGRISRRNREGATGIGLYPDGMVEHDDMVGAAAEASSTSSASPTTPSSSTATDNGAETVTWPDGGITPFHGEKGTTWEGGFRVPMLVRWPGVIKPGTIINDILSHEDWMPTLARRGR